MRQTTMEKLTFLKKQVTSKLTEDLSNADYFPHGTDGFFFKENPKSSFFTLYMLKEDGEPFDYLDKSMGLDSSNFLAQFLLNMNPFFISVFKDLSNDKISSVLQKMWQLAALNYGSFIKGGMSYCSHSEGYLTTLKNREIVKAKYESYFHKHFNALKNLYLETKANLDESRIDLEHLKKQVKTSFNEGNIHFYYDTSINSVNKGMLTSSAFHRALIGNKKFQNRLENDSGFKTSRFITISEYLWLRSLGTDLQKRMFYCYLCYRTIEEVDKINYISLAKSE